MKTKLDRLAMEMNAGLEKSGANERWTLDKDSESNSVGYWFCGNLGGVGDAQTMREHTYGIIAARYGLAINGVRRWFRGLRAQARVVAQ